MIRIVDMTGSGKYAGLWKCAKCSSEIYNDNGWVMSDSTIICRNSQHCDKQAYLLKTEAEKKAGTYVKPLWRR